MIPGVGPATAERLRRVGVHTVAELEQVSEDELVRISGRRTARSLHQLAAPRTTGRWSPSGRPSRSASRAPTTPTWSTGGCWRALLDRQAGQVAERLRKARLSGRTVTVKVRLHDFTTHTRSATLAAPTDDTPLVARLARALLGEVDTSGGVRLLGVGVSGLADWIQEDLFGRRRDATGSSDPEPVPRARGASSGSTRARRLGSRHGRRARRARPGLGVGLGRGPGDGALRDRRDRARPGAHVPDGRPRPGAAPAARPVRRQRRVKRTSVARPQLRALPAGRPGRTTATTG